MSVPDCVGDTISMGYASTVCQYRTCRSTRVGRRAPEVCGERGALANLRDDDQRLQRAHTH
eukprot:364304-Rhodomonas_salina.1